MSRRAINTGILIKLLKKRISLKHAAYLGTLVHPGNF